MKILATLAIVRIDNESEVVWEGDRAEYNRCFPGGLDSDNRKVYKLIYCEPKEIIVPDLPKD